MLRQWEVERSNVMALMKLQKAKKMQKYNWGKNLKMILILQRCSIV